MLSSDAALLANSVAQDLVEVTENAAKSTSMFAMMQEGVVRTTPSWEQSCRDRATTDTF